VTAGRHFEAHAEPWVRWVRTPGHDAYWYFRDAFLDRLPAPSGQALEVGCGEGRVTRDLRARGHAVVGVDVAPTLLRHAREADPGGAYLLADAAALPFPDASFDLVVAYNSLMDVDDLGAAVAEAARVLTAQGRLCACVTHPFGDVGRFAGREPDAPYLISGAYHGSRRFEARVEHDGLGMTFSGWAHSLESYSRALEEAGLLVEALHEPRPAPEAGGRHARWSRVPLHLHLRCRRALETARTSARRASSKIR
jgi:SAM-dependent methyltransferase